MLSDIVRIITAVQRNDISCWAVIAGRARVLRVKPRESITYAQGRLIDFCHKLLGSALSDEDSNPGGAGSMPEVRGRLNGCAAPDELEPRKAVPYPNEVCRHAPRCCRCLRGAALNPSAASNSSRGRAPSAAIQSMAESPVTTSTRPERTKHWSRRTSTQEPTRLVQSLQASIYASLPGPLSEPAALHHVVAHVCGHGIRSAP
jgi:hypothetical protein